MEGKTVFEIHEPARHGKPDNYRKVEIPHDPKHRAELETISEERVNNPLDDKEYKETMELFEVPNIGTVVFVNVYDTDTSSATYRMGAHHTDGPYLLEKHG
jgi:hypothetical protein